MHKVGSDRSGLNDRASNDSHGTTLGRNVVQIDINSLRQHPRQDEFFADTPESRLIELAKDMEANGQRDPILVLPDGTIISGHRRVAAARQCNWSKIDAIIRDDLTDDVDGATELFISDNYHRRQLSMLQEARCALELYIIAKRRGKTNGKAAAKWVGDRLGWSPKNAG